MKTIILKKKEPCIFELGKELFDKITTLPADVRPVDEKRTGIQIYIRQLGTRNSAFVSVYSPSKDDITFSVEQSVRTEILGDYSSQDSANPDLMRFAGCVVMELDGIKYHSSVSGLKETENVYMAVVLMREVLGINIKSIVDYLYFYGAMLPKELEYNFYGINKLKYNTYLNNILKEYC